jgi:hypothetical protein
MVACYAFFDLRKVSDVLGYHAFMNSTMVFINKKTESYYRIVVIPDLISPNSLPVYSISGLRAENIETILYSVH